MRCAGVVARDLAVRRKLDFLQSVLQVCGVMYKPKPWNAGVREIVGMVEYAPVLAAPLRPPACHSRARSATQLPSALLSEVREVIYYLCSRRGRALDARRMSVDLSGGSLGTFHSNEFFSEDVLALLPDVGLPPENLTAESASAHPPPAIDSLRGNSRLVQQLCAATTTDDCIGVGSDTTILASEPLVPSAANGDAPLPADASHAAVEPTPAHDVAAILQMEPRNQQLEEAVVRLLNLGPGDGLGKQFVQKGPVQDGSTLLLDRLLEDALSSKAPLHGPVPAVRPSPQRPASAPSARLASPAMLGSWSPQATARREEHSAAGMDDGAEMAYGQDGVNAGVRLYARQLTWKQRNQQRYEDMRWEEGRRELEGCTFFPRICSRSRQLSGRAANGSPAAPPGAQGFAAAQMQAHGSNAGVRIYKRQLTQRLRAQQRCDAA